jgi:hypothetical protein
LNTLQALLPAGLGGCRASNITRLQRRWRAQRLRLKGLTALDVKLHHLRSKEYVVRMTKALQKARCITPSGEQSVPIEKQELVTRFNH